MGSVSYEEKVRENKFLVDRLTQKLVQAGKIAESDVQDITWLFRSTLVCLEDKTPKERLEVLMRVFSEHYSHDTADKDPVASAEIQKNEHTQPVDVPKIVVPTQQETVPAKDDEKKRRKEEVNLITAILCAISDDKDIAEDMRVEAREYILKENEYVLGTGMNESVIRRIVENTLHDFKQKKGLYKQVTDETSIFDAVLLQEDVSSIVPERSGDVHGDHAPQEVVSDVLPEPTIPTIASPVLSETISPEPISPEPTVPDVVVVDPTPQPLVSPQPLTPRPAIVMEEVSETPVSVNYESEPVNNTPSPAVVTMEQTQRQSPPEIVSHANIQVAQDIVSPALPVQSQTPPKPDVVIAKPPVVEEVVPVEMPMSSETQEVVEMTTPPEEPFPPKADGILVEDTATAQEGEFFEEEQESEPVFKTRITSESKYTSSGRASKGSLAQAMRARAREQDKQTPLISHQQAIPMPQRFSGSKKPKVTEAEIAAVKIIEESSNGVPSSANSVPPPPAYPLNVPQKKGIAWASNTKEVFDKVTDVVGSSTIDRHELLLQQKALINKYVVEQINTVLQVVSSEGMTSQDDLEKLRKELIQESQILANEKDLSISDKINKLDRMFMEKRNGYASRNNRKETTTLEEMVDTVLARAGKEVRTKDPESDARFRETLRDTLHFKAKHLVGIGMDKNNVQSALDEEYVKHKAFYLKNNR